MRNLFTNFDATKRHDPSAPNLFPDRRKTQRKDSQITSASYDPNTVEDMIEANAIMNELELRRHLRFR